MSRIHLVDRESRDFVAGRDLCRADIAAVRVDADVVSLLRSDAP